MTTYSSYNSKRPLEVLAFETVADIPTDFHGIAQIADGTVYACHAGTNTKINLTAGNALTTNPLSQFAATTSLQLKGVLSDETGSGAVVFAESPTLVTPVLGTPSSGNLSNCTALPIASTTGVLSSDRGGTGLNLASMLIKVELGSPADAVTTAVAIAQAVAGAGNLTLDGTLATDGVVTFVEARAVQAVSTDAADTTQTLHFVGTNILNAAMSETITLTGQTPAIGKKAFKTITQVAVSDICAGNISAGNTSILGLPFKLTAKSDLVGTWFNDILETTLPTIALGDSTPASATTGDTRGTLTLDSTLDGSKVACYISVYPLTVVGLYGDPEYSA